MTITELNTKRDALISAMAQGILRVKVGEIETEYQSIEMMRQALAVLNTESASQSAGGGSRYSVAEFRR